MSTLIFGFALKLSRCVGSVFLIRAIYRRGVADGSVALPGFGQNLLVRRQEHFDYKSYWGGQMRLSKTIFLGLVLTVLQLSGGVAQANATYDYSGMTYGTINNFTPPCGTGVCADYTSGMRVTGSFTVQTALPPNFSGSLAGNPNLLSWSFSDGVNTLTSESAGALVFTVTTDAVGNVTAAGTHITLGIFVAASRVNAIVINALSPGDEVANNIIVSGPSFTTSTDGSTSTADSGAYGVWAPLIVPTLNSWALVALALLFAGFGSLKVFRWMA
jgi:hypothetical protein